MNGKIIVSRRDIGTKNILSNSPPRKFNEFSRHFFKLIPFIWPKSNDGGNSEFLILRGDQVEISSSYMLLYDDIGTSGEFARANHV